MKTKSLLHLDEVGTKKIGQRQWTDVEYKIRLDGTNKIIEVPEMQAVKLICRQQGELEY